MKLEVFQEMRLVGGTSLALQLGHRNSIKRSKNINIFSLNGIKVDIVNYPYQWLDSVIFSNDIRMAGMKDIAAMKLAAITGRGTKKDFMDLFFLLKKFSLAEMMDFYRQKYNDGAEAIVLKSLTYFHDANDDTGPIMLKKADWEGVKTKIRKEVKSYVEHEKKS